MREIEERKNKRKRRMKGRSTKLRLIRETGMGGYVGKDRHKK